VERLEARPLAQLDLERLDLVQDLVGGGDEVHLVVLVGEHDAGPADRERLQDAGGEVVQDRLHRVVGRQRLGELDQQARESSFIHGGRSISMGDRCLGTFADVLTFPGGTP
jgi:hypothetical protein